MTLRTLGCCFKSPLPSKSIGRQPPVPLILMTVVWSTWVRLLKDVSTRALTRWAVFSAGVSYLVRIAHHPSIRKPKKTIRDGPSNDLAHFGHFLSTTPVGRLRR